ncbi:MAG: DUF983 domain-containing protein [Planctomycetaceae bacterium]|nr:DUF983 domain-containing protein [Planctomycetaceae bacterium]
MNRDEPPSEPRPPLETLIGRALRLRCPRCGRGKLFLGWFRMPERCSECRLKYERAPGYFLGSTYINYGLTAGFLTTAYFVLHFGMGLSNRQLTWPLTAFCIAFPLAAFRYARALWLALDCHFDQSILADES